MAAENTNKVSTIKISIIIPMHNEEKYLQECLESVLSQTINDIEVICVDDGSTDNTLQILQGYDDSRLTIIKQNRQGAGMARNRALDVASGEFVAFMDADDYYPCKNTLENMYIYAKKNEVDAVGGSLLLDHDGKVEWDSSLTRKKRVFMNDDVIEFLDYQFFCGYWRFIYKLETLRKYNIYFPSYRRFQDPPFMLKALNSIGRFGTLREGTYVYRIYEKKINYENTELICDFASAFIDMLEYSTLYNLDEVERFICDVLLLEYKNRFLAHLSKGNNTLRELLVHIGNMIEGNNRVNECNDYTIETNIDRRIAEYVDKITNIYDNVDKYLQVIIYGAGAVGRDLYDMLYKYNEQAEYIFVETKIDKKKVIGDIEVKEIESLNKINKNIPVFICNISHYQEMYDKAVECGFNTIIVINEFLIRPDIG